MLPPRLNIVIESPAKNAIWQPLLLALKYGRVPSRYPFLTSLDPVEKPFVPFQKILARSLRIDVQA
jgi:hypothetical protein